jgi:hypothetical protein
VVAVPEDKPKSVTSDVNKESEKKEVSGMYHSSKDFNLQKRGMNEDKIAWF